MCVPADAPSVTTGAMAEEEEEVADDGKTMAFTRDGVTALARTAGRTSLAREDGGISLARIAHKATRASLLCHHSRGGMKTSISMRGLGASRSRVLSLASWAELKPQPLNASSSSSPAK